MEHQSNSPSGARAFHHQDRTPRGVALSFLHSGHHVPQDRCNAVAALVAEHGIHGALDWSTCNDGQVAQDLHLLIRAESDADNPETALTSLAQYLRLGRPVGIGAATYDYRYARALRLQAIITARTLRVAA